MIDPNLSQQIDEALELTPLIPWRVETVSGRYIVLQCTSYRRLVERFAAEYPDESARSISKVQ